jgi:hypothetical protein
MTFGSRLACTALAATLVAAATGLAGQRPEQPDKEPPIRLGPPLRVDPKDDPLRKLLKERYNAVLEETKLRHVAVEAGRATLDEVFDAFQRLLRAGLEVAETHAQRVALLKQNLDLATEVERIIAKKVQAGALPDADLHRARYNRLDAEIRLLRFTKAKGPERR